jgi:hypothetical protein
VTESGHAAINQTQVEQQQQNNNSRKSPTTAREKDAEKNKTEGATGNIEKRNWQNVKLVRTIDKAHDGVFKSVR